MYILFFLSDTSWIQAVTIFFLTLKFLSLLTIFVIKMGNLFWTLPVLKKALLLNRILMKPLTWHACLKWTAEGHLFGNLSTVSLSENSVNMVQSHLSSSKPLCLVAVLLPFPGSALAPFPNCVVLIDLYFKCQLCFCSWTCHSIPCLLRMFYELVSYA